MISHVFGFSLDKMAVKNSDALGELQDRTLKAISVLLYYYSRLFVAMVDHLNTLPSFVYWMNDW